MSPPEWHAEAKRLRAEGLLWREIAERVGRHLSTVEAAVTALDARPRESKWEHVHPRAEQIVAWWAEGRSLTEIGERLGWSKNHLTNEMIRLRAKGYDIPYRYRRPR